MTATTESKKLQTNLYKQGGLSGEILSLIHDARLAHEMLPVLRQLATTLAAVQDPALALSIREALAAAAPFLKTDTPSGIPLTTDCSSSRP